MADLDQLTTPSAPSDLGDADVVRTAELFKALGNPVRVQLLAMIRQSPGEEACFCDLAEGFDQPQSSLSHHLKILVDAGILSRSRRGTWSWYRIEHGPFDQVAELVRAGGPLREAPPGQCD